MDLSVLQIPDSAVYEARGSSRRTAREVITFYEHDFQSSHRGVAGHPAASDSSSNHEDVEVFVRGFSHSHPCVEERARAAMIAGGQCGSIGNLTARFGYPPFGYANIIRHEQ